MASHQLSAASYKPTAAASKTVGRVAALPKIGNAPAVLAEQDFLAALVVLLDMEAAAALEVMLVKAGQAALNSQAAAQEPAVVVVAALATVIIAAVSALS